jgi:hypothetical protein
MNAVIFLGPSLPLHEAQGILHATYLPPARQADLLTATVNYQPDVIGLIDGVFLHSLSVWHKEILYALDLGIRVYGASSMGALRAAETAAFGMIGIGEIYRQFASGELIDDDEVALAHASADKNYLKLSEPMVNIRATFAAAERAGIIDAIEHRRLNAIAKGFYFADRTFPAILEEARHHGVSEAALDRLSDFMKGNYVDLKKQDAVQLLKTVRDLTFAHQDNVVRGATFTFGRSTSFKTLYNRDRHIQANGIAFPLEAIANLVAVHDPDFEKLHFDALNRAVVCEFANLLGVSVSEEEIQAEAGLFRKKKNLVEDEAFLSWLDANHLKEEEFRGLMTQIAHCRRLHRWFLMAMWMERTTKVVLDELRLRGSYVYWADKTSVQERLIQRVKAYDGPDGHPDISMEELLLEHAEWTDCRIDIDPAVWSEEAGFHSVGNLKMELLRSRMARRALLELLAEAVSSTSEPG